MTTPPPPHQPVADPYAAAPGAPLGGAYPQSSPSHAAGTAEDVGEVSVGDLIGNVTRDLSTLLRQELALAQAELKQEAVKTAKGGGAMAGAAVAGFFVLMFLSIALWAGLSNVMDAGWAGLIVAVIAPVRPALLPARDRARPGQPRPTCERPDGNRSHVPHAGQSNRSRHAVPFPMTPSTSAARWAGPRPISFPMWPRSPRRSR